MKQQHILIVKTEEKIRRMNQFIKTHKNRKNSGTVSEKVSLKDQITDLNKDIEIMEEENQLEIDELKEKISGVQ